MRKLLVASQRSGVGKTTTSINLAAATAMAGARVLLLEADPMSGISSALNLAQHPERQPLRASGVEIPGVLCTGIIPGLDVVSPYEEGGCSDEHLEQVLQLLGSSAFQDQYDCLVVNAPPFLGARPEPMLAACDEYVVVMQAESMAHRMLPAFNELIQRSTKQAGVQIQWRGIVLTLPESEAVGGSVERELRGRFGTRVLPVVIPYDEEVNKAQMFGHVLVHASPEAPAAVEYKELASNLRLASTVVAGRTHHSVCEMLVLAAPAVQPVVPRRAEPIVNRKSRATIPAVRPSIPTPPPSPLEPPHRSSEETDAGKPAWTPPVLTRSSGRHKPLSAPGTVPTEHVGARTQPPRPVAPPAPAPAPAPQAARPFNAVQWLPWVGGAIALGFGIRFLPLGSLLESELMMPVAVGVATTATVGLILWVMAQQPTKPETPPDQSKR